MFNMHKIAIISVLTTIMFGGVPTYASEKILIITHAFERPDFIAIQHKTFKRFLQDPYEFVVFNDARNETKRDKIRVMCKQLGIRCIDIPQEIHDRPYLPRMPNEEYNHPCVRCANVVQYSLDMLGFKYPGIVAIVDSDMFLTKKFSIEEYMKEHCLAAVPQSRAHVHYVWNGLVFLDMNKLPDKETINFNCGKIDGIGLDVGGYTYNYLCKHPSLRIKEMGVTYPHGFICALCQFNSRLDCVHNTKILEEHNFSPQQIEFIQKGPHNVEFILGTTFLHYRGGGNWDDKPQNYHQGKTAMLLQFIARLMED